MSSLQDLPKELLIEKLLLHPIDQILKICSADRQLLRSVGKIIFGVDFSDETFLVRVFLDFRTLEKSILTVSELQNESENSIGIGISLRPTSLTWR